MKKKNIMLLIGYLNNGGAEKSIVKLSKELEKDNNVFFVVANSKNQDYKTNLKVFEIPELRSMKTKLIGIWKVKMLKKRLKIDTSISYTTVFNFINVITKVHDKTIISIRNYLSLKEKEKLYKFLNIISLKYSDIVVCCSKAVRYDQIKNYHAPKNKLVVIENFYSPEIKKLANEKVDINNYIITIARLEQHKGLIELIKAFKIVVNKNQNLKLLIFGRGEMKDSILKLINDLNLNNNIFLKGFTSNPYKYLKNARCFVLTSYYEGFSNSIIEAMACSCPIVAFDSPGGNREILTNSYYNEKKYVENFSYGILVKENDPLKIAKAIEKVLINYSYYSKISFERSKKYTNNKIMRKWYKIL